MIFYSKGKRAKRENRLVEVILIALVIFGVLYILITNILIESQFETGKLYSLISKETFNLDKLKRDIEPTSEDDIYTEEIPAKMNGYKVIGQLVIDKIEVKKNILSVNTKNALNVSVVKDRGPNINEIGNLCLAGHNWGNMLARLKELKVGDTFYLVNRKDKSKVTYKVFEIKVYTPTDTSSLSQETNGRREVTIYTCTPNGSKRVVCKAREI